jgi:ABC-2 type transport system permease protein
MRIIEVIRKTTLEQLRSFWILLLTVVMAPFFVGVYYLINESSRPSYDIIIVNHDKGCISANIRINHGEELLLTAESETIKGIELPVKIIRMNDVDSATKLLKKKKADALIVIPEGFSDSLNLGLSINRPIPPEIEFIGDMNDFQYMISAIWGSEVLRVYIENISGFPSPFKIKEINLSQVTGLSDFDLYMPGLIVLSIIMLMFSASIAFVTEIENGTILRFRLSGLATIEFIIGVTFIQLIIGIISVLITLGTAILLGFQSNGSLWLALLVISLAALSIIAFSVILGSLTKSSNEILVIGNFPLFLFMFFTGAAFPMEGKAIFTIAGYGLNYQGLMSPTHAVSAMKKVMLMNSGISEIMPEIISLIALTLIYFGIGIWLFNKRHMKFGSLK